MLIVVVVTFLTQHFFYDLCLCGCGYLYFFFFFVKEELAILRRQLDGKDGELRRLQDETGSRSPTPAGLETAERGESTSTCSNTL